MYFQLDMKAAKHIKDLARKSLFSALTLLLVLVAFEVGARLLPPQRSSYPDDTPYVDDPVLGHVGRPDYTGWFETPEIGRIQVRHNAHGLRDHVDYGPKRPGVFRILGLGDSFTWGDACPYEESYLRVAEKALEGRTTERVEIVKAGLQAYTTGQELLYLKTRGRAFQPDLITIGFAANDLISSYPLTEDGTGLARPQDNHLRFFDPPLWMRPVYFLRDKSEFYQRARSWMYNSGEFYTWIFLKRSGRDTYVSKEWSRGYTEQLEVIRSLLEQVVAEADDLGVPVLLIYIPQRFQILVGQSDPLSTRYQADKINQELAALCGPLGIEFLDTYPELLAASGEEPVFFPVDGHLKPRGYRLVGEMLARHLLGRRLGPSETIEPVSPAGR